ncbi:MAG: NINE protein [Bacilli bacterium]|nr:NINE protein [Bacilli bacterium]
MKYCIKCGAEMEDSADVCPVCGFGMMSVSTSKLDATKYSPKSRLVAILLCFFLGTFGVHRFYVGKVGTGVVWLLTCGCLGIGFLVDLIMIACGSFTDKEGKFVKFWGVDD